MSVSKFTTAKSPCPARQLGVCCIYETLQCETKIATAILVALKVLLAHFSFKKNKTLDSVLLPQFKCFSAMLTSGNELHHVEPVSGGLRVGSGEDGLEAAGA